MIISKNRGLSSQEIDIERASIHSQNSTNCEIPINAIYVRSDVNISMDNERHDIEKDQIQQPRLLEPARS